MSVQLSKRAVLWVMADTMGTSVLSIITLLLIARLAGPSEFGLAALITGAVMLVNLYVEGLFHDALIQNQKAGELAFEQALTLVAIIAFAIVIVVLTAALILNGGPYRRIGWYAVVASVSLIFTGLNGVGNARQRRDMEYRHVARASVFGRTMGCIVALIVALKGYGTLGLILQTTVGAMAQSCVLYWTTAWRPTLRFSFDGEIKPVLRFALPYAVMHTIVAARMQLFAFTVAALMGLSAAGYINVAFRMTTTPQVTLMTALTNLCFPMLAHKQSSAPDLRAAYSTATKIISTLTLPLFCGIALTADDLVPLILGKAWMQSILLVKILALSAAIVFVRLSSSLLLRAIGLVRYSFWNAMFQLAVTLGGLILLRPHDPLIAVYLWVVPVVIQVPLTWYFIRREAGLSVFQQLKSALPAIAAVTLMAVTVSVVRAQTLMWPMSIRAALSIFAGAVAFSVAVIAFDSQIRSFLLSNNALLAWARPGRKTQL